MMTSLSNDAPIAFEDAFRLQVTIHWTEHYLLLEEGSLRVSPWLAVRNELTSGMPVVIG